MQTLINPSVKPKIVSFDNATYHDKKKLNNSKTSLDFKFYQTLFILVLTLCSFLIFPESPQDHEILCKKYHSNEACNVW